MYKSLWRTSFTYATHARRSTFLYLRISQEPVHTREILSAQLRLLLNHPPIHFPGSRPQWQLSPRLVRNVARQSHVLLLSNYETHVRQAFTPFPLMPSRTLPRTRVRTEVTCQVTQMEQDCSQRSTSSSQSTIQLHCSAQQGPVPVFVPLSSLPRQLFNGCF
jgi:hypothetical protein